MPIYAGNGGVHKKVFNSAIVANFEYGGTCYSSSSSSDGDLVVFDNAAGEGHCIRFSINKAYCLSFIICLKEPVTFTAGKRHFHFEGVYNIDANANLGISTVRRQTEEGSYQVVKSIPNAGGYSEWFNDWDASYSSTTTTQYLNIVYD